MPAMTERATLIEMTEDRIAELRRERDTGTLPEVAYGELCGRISELHRVLGWLEGQEG